MGTQETLLKFGRPVLVHARYVRQVGPWRNDRSPRTWDRQPCESVVEAVYLGEGLIFDGHCKRQDDQTRWVAESGIKAVRVAVPGPRIVDVPPDGFRLWTWNNRPSKQTPKQQISLFETEAS